MSATSPAPATTPGIDLERWAPLPPLVLVNIVAIYGQYGWAEANLPGITVAGSTFPLWAVLFAAALESIAIYLSYEAHKARMAGDSSAKLWAAAYVVALLAGALNYWHLADPVTHQPTPAAVAFAAMSLLSPWLWGIRSRSMNRDLLRKLDLIEPRAVKFSTARWALFPAATFRAFRAAVWVGETNPRAAIALLEQSAADLSITDTPPPDVSVKSPISDTPATTPTAAPATVKPAAKSAPVKTPVSSPSREQARAILMDLRDFEAEPNAKLSREHGGSDTFWRQRKDALRAELAAFTTEAGNLNR